MNRRKKKFNIQYHAQFTSETRDNRLRVWLAKPADSIYQKIDKFLVSPKPKSSYKDDQGNQILYFDFRDFRKLDLSFDISVNLYQKEINFKSKNLTLLRSKSLQRFLKKENFLEQTTKVKKMAIEITKDKKLLYEKIEAIFNFVVSNFKYCHPVKKRGVKNLKLDRLKGDCGEYSSLLVAMLRSLNIPSRNQTGFVVYPGKKKVMEHGWASVYIRPFGWVDLDAQYASLDKKNNQKYFGQRSDFRISFVNGFNIPVRPKISSGFQAKYWRRVGLPFSSNSVQTLQPIFFVSKRKIKFRESVKLV